MIEVDIELTGLAGYVQVKGSPWPWIRKFRRSILKGAAGGARAALTKGNSVFRKSLRKGILDIPPASKLWLKIKRKAKMRLYRKVLMMTGMYVLSWKVSDATDFFTSILYGRKVYRAYAAYPRGMATTAKVVNNTIVSITTGILDGMTNMQKGLIFELGRDWSGIPRKHLKFLAVLVALNIRLKVPAGIRKSADAFWAGSKMSPYRVYRAVVK